MAQAFIYRWDGVMLYIFLQYIKHLVADASIVTQCWVVWLLFVPANQQPVENLVIIDFYWQI